ncbi:MAG: alpha/beta fold hydrolase [Acidobacteriota bacterium]|nr:alpha/beta fold hydrolase [Acidobacteriota bacterium]
MNQPRSPERARSRLAAPPLPDWLAPLVPFERSLIDVGEHRMHLMEGGDPAGRPLLMVHGNPTWGFLYRKVVAALPDDRFRVVLPDVVGLGLSDKPRDSKAHRLDNHARWLGALLDALALDDVLLVVQDWGGPIGLAAFDERRERLSGLVVLNTVIGPPKPGFRPTRFHRLARLPLVSDVVFRVLGFPQTALARAQGDRASISGTTARAYRWPLRRVRDRTAPLALARMVPDSHAHPSIAGLERSQSVATSLTGPAAIVWGNRDPILGRVRRHIERLLPAAPVTQTEAGHFLQEEVPAEIAAAILQVDSRAR